MTNEPRDLVQELIDESGADSRVLEASSYWNQEGERKGPVMVVKRPQIVQVSSMDLLEFNFGTDTFLEDHYEDGGMSWDRLGDAHDPGEELVEFAGRVCYMAFGEDQFRHSSREYIENLISQEHYSVLEHAQATFVIWGVSRTLSHELVRHRIASYSQLSQRYVDDKHLAFVVPPEILAGAGQRLYPDFVSDALRDHERYQFYVQELSEDLKQNPLLSPRERRLKARQTARWKLPGATETKIVMTLNMRSLREILLKRGGQGAEPEIRRLALLWLRLVKERYPLIFSDLHEDNGTIRRYARRKQENE